MIFKSLTILPLLASFGLIGCEAKIEVVERRTPKQDEIDNKEKPDQTIEDVFAEEFEEIKRKSQQEKEERLPEPTSHEAP